MSYDLLDWLSFAIGLFSLLLAFWQMRSRKPQTIRHSRERLRMLKWGKFEWTSHDREDESQS